MTETKRFHYKPLKNKPQVRKYLLYLIVAIVVVVALAIFWLWPSWYADINLQTQLYSNKANADFINVYFLNFWGTNFLFNKTALIGALIGSIIMTIPPDKTFLTTIGTRLGFGKPSYAKSLIFWWTIGFVIFYFLGFLLDFSATSFSWIAYLIENGEMTLEPTIISDAFSVLFNSGSKDFITIFIYGGLILPIITFTLSVLIFRVILNIVRNVYLRRNDYYALANVFIAIGLLFGLWFFNTPIQALDGINLIQIWAVIIGFISFPILGLLIYIYGRSNYSRDSKNYTLTIPKIKKIGYVGFLLIILLVIPLIISIGPALSINDTSVWIEQQWTKKYQREVDWTTDCAGLDMFEERTIENFSLSTTTTDEIMVSQVRQYDQNFAVQYLAASIGSTYEGLADSDIVYINGKEYWVAPKTIRFTQITGDPVQRSTELLDHVEGFLAMDTFSGVLVNITETFNITENYPIFFGESESERFLQTLGTINQEGILGAYDSDILLETEWAGNTTNYDYRYSSQPDGTLTGLESFWKKINLGLIAYSTRPENNYLINRNVKTRVGNILLPQLSIDYDPYLVFDSDGGKLYYAVSIYTNIYVGSYAMTPVLRFLGVCLVDVIDGDMTFYENPKLDKINDPTAPLWTIYLSNSIYDWETTIPDWLLAQLRYPEDLFEQQLEANYKYHVNQPTVWKSEVDFHERPKGGDLYYIESDLGEGVEYVGLDLVEYQGDSANILAGMYVVRHGVHFGEAIFYHTRDSGASFLGPQSANQTYLSEATQDISLIAGARNGNILLYPLAGSIYYYIPTYSTSGSLQQLKLAGFVEARSRKVGYGENAQLAYLDLNITGEIGDSNLTLTYDFNIETIIDYPNDPAQFTITLQNTDTNYSAPGLNVMVNLSIYTTIDVNYTLLVPSYLYPIENSTYTFFIDTESYTGMNFTLIDTNLFFGEGLVLNGYLATSIGNINIYAKWTLIIDGKIEYQSPVNIINVY